VLSFFFELGVSCIRPVYYGLRPFVFLKYTYIKKKELRKLLINTLYLWIATHHSLSVFTYADFLNLFSVLSYEGFSCILPVC